MDIVEVIVRWFEGFAAQGQILVRVLPDIGVIPVMGGIGLVSLGLFFWVDDYLLHGRGR